MKPTLSQFMYEKAMTLRGLPKRKSPTWIPCSQITGHVFIGGDSVAYSFKALKKLNIKGVLNCTKSLYNKFPTHFEYLRIPVDDSLKQKDIDLMARMLPLAAEYIHKHADILKQNVYVHCAQGRQRSVACVVAYLMKYKGMDPYAACEYVLNKRKESFYFGLSVNFENAIVRYWKTLHN